MSTMMRVLLDAAAGTTESPTGIQWLDVLLVALKNFINPILIVACTAGIIYAIVVGIRFVKADDKSARDEAKAKLISVIIGIVVTIVLVVVFYWLSANIGNIIDQTKFTENATDPSAIISFLKF